MKKIGKIIFWITWIGILIFLHLGIVSSSEYSDSSSVTLCIIGIVIWWVITIGITATVWKIQDKKKKKYKEKYINTTEYIDDRYGKIIFKHNLEKHILSSQIQDVIFDEKKLKFSILNISDNTDLRILFDNLKKYSDNSKTIKERIYHELPIQLNRLDNYDKEGNLFNVSEQFLRENFNFDLIVIQDLKTISIWGSWDSLYEQDYSINYNCSDDTIKVEVL